MELSVVYSKTAKGLRTRASLIGGLPSQLRKVLTHVDGTTTAQSILLKLNDFTEEKLIVALHLLEREGYIKLVAVTHSNDNDWALTANFTPMEVEEVLSVEETEAKAKEDARLEVVRKAEIEEEARRKSDLMAKIEAEKARSQAEEARKKTEADLKVKVAAIAQEQAQREAERMARDAEEAQKKLAAEQKARAEKASKLAEEAARVEAERIAKVEEKAKETERQAKAAAEMRQKAELKAKEEAERKAKQEVEQAIKKAEDDEKNKAHEKERARLEIARIVHEAEEARKKAETKAEDERLEAKAAEDQKKSEANALAKAEEEAKLAAELKIKADQEAVLQAEARDLARVEMERVERQTQEAAETNVSDSTHATEVRWRATPDINDDDEAHFAQEEHKVKLEIEKKNKRETEGRGLQAIKHAAREQAEAWSRYAKRSLRLLNYAKRLAKVKKITLVYLPLAVLLLVGWLHFINISPLIDPIEKLATESLGRPVKIGTVRASLWPQPHLVLSNVEIGGKHKIEAVHVIPETSSLSAVVKTLKSIEIEGLKIDQDSFGQPQQWIDSLSQAEHLQVEQIHLKKIIFKLRDLTLGPFNGKVVLAESKALKSIYLETVDETLSVQITPQIDSADLVLTGANWPLPVNPKIVFDEFKATGNINQRLIYFSQIEGEIYSGSITAKATIDWSNQWSLAGNFDLSNATLSRLLQAFGSSASVDGKLNLTGIFSCQSEEASKLTDAPEVTASFEVREGKINGVNLVQAVLSTSNKSLAGDATRFDTLTGNIQINHGAYQYKQLVLETDQFHARGNVDIAPNQDVAGNVSANLDAQSRRLQSSFNLAGKVGAVQRQ